MRAPAHIAAAALALIAGAASAQDPEVSRSDFRYVSELAQRGFTPIAAQGGGAVLGMHKGDEIYICYLADTSALQTERQQVLLAEIDGAAETRAVPDIPLLCVATR